MNYNILLSNFHELQHLIVKFSLLYNNKHVSFKTRCVHTSVHTVLTELTLFLSTTSVIY